MINQVSFQNNEPSVSQVCFKILVSWSKFRNQITPVFTQRIIPLVFTDNLVIEYFDGSYENGLCGARMLYKDSESHFVKLWMGTRQGSNMRDELLSLWGLLWFVMRTHVSNIQIVGDSKVVIHWTNGKYSLYSLALDHWMSTV